MKPQYPIPSDVMNVITNMLGGATESEPCKQVAFRIATFAFNAGITAGLYSALSQLEEKQIFIQALTKQREKVVL
jgi:hypothetical protein